MCDAPTTFEDVIIEVSPPYNQLVRLNHRACERSEQYFRMQKPLIARSLGGLAIASMGAATSFDVIFAFSLNGAKPSIQLLAFVAFAIDLLVIATLCFLVTYYVGKLRLNPIGMRRRLCWRYLAMGIIVTLISSPLALVTLLSLNRDLEFLAPQIVNQPAKTMLVAWGALFVISVLLRLAFFAFLLVWTKQALKTQLAEQQSLDLDFGIGTTDMLETRPDTRGTTQSFQSQENTLVSPPRTPTTPRRKSSLQSSSSTKVGPGSSRTRLIQDSAKSSLDFPGSERSALDNGFDRWDTSSVHQEVRAALQSSPPVTRSGLATIPGSRPESPANALDGPFLPSSPHAASSDSATAVDWMPSSSRKASLSSPPSSPPNFSRPTSSQRNKASLPSNNVEELVHPLFRTNSPETAPIAAPGTTITASPIAGQPITPRTLSRMRSGTYPQNSTTNLAGNFESGSSNSSAPDSPGPGSPGPSIVEEEDLPPILPGFVLSAGNRSSLVGYGKRKSIKERRRASQRQRL